MTEEVLRPEDSLETWSMIFLSGIGPGGDFRFLLNGYIRLVEQWISNDQLTGELQTQTNGFLYTFVPDAIDKVLNLPYLSLDDQSECMKFLKATSEMIPYAVVRENDAAAVLDVYIGAAGSSARKNGVAGLRPRYDAVGNVDSAEVEAYVGQRRILPVVIDDVVAVNFRQFGIGNRASVPVEGVEPIAVSGGPRPICALGRQNGRSQQSCREPLGPQSGKIVFH